jgi:hypothetical protein
MLSHDFMQVLEPHYEHRQLTALRAESMYTIFGGVRCCWGHYLYDRYES